jgi:hypothetical protein
MKNPTTILKILAAFFLFASCVGAKRSGNSEAKVKVSGTVTQTFSYCGGARPSNEMLAKLNEPKPFANKVLFILKGNSNDFNSMNYIQISSDSLGNFSVSLEPGEYCLVDEFKHHKSNFDDILKKYEKETTNYSAVDPDCLKNWFNTPDLVFTVAKTGNKDLSIVYHHPCSWHAIPCVNYRGPLPP